MIVLDIFKGYVWLQLIMYKGTGIRLPIKMIKLIESVCSLRGESRSSFIRRAIMKELARLGKLDDKSKKALEVEND